MKKEKCILDEYCLERLRSYVGEFIGEIDDAGAQELAMGICLEFGVPCNSWRIIGAIEEHGVDLGEFLIRG